MFPIVERALRAEAGDQHCHACADVGALHALAVELRGAAHDRPMRIAEDDPGAHVTSLSTKKSRFSNIFSKISTVPRACVATASAIE